MSKITNLIFKNATHYVTSGFGNRKIMNTKGGYTSSFHNGTDYGTNSVKLPQYAIENGTVLSCSTDKLGGKFVWVKYPRINVNCKTVTNSPAMNKEINSKIRELEKSGNTSQTFNDSISFYGNYNIYDFSLSLAIGRSDYEIKIEKQMRIDAGISYYRYKVDVTLKEDYAFDGLRRSLKIPDILNNFGYLMQEANAFRSYYYDVKCAPIYTNWEADI